MERMLVMSQTLICRLKRLAIQLGLVAGSLTAIMILWNQLDLPKIAWSTEIKGLKEEQVKQGVDLYTGQVRTFLYHPPAKDVNPIVLEQWREVVREKRKSLKLYEDRYIEIQKEKIR